MCVRVYIVHVSRVVCVARSPSLAGAKKSGANNRRARIPPTGVFRKRSLEGKKLEISTKI